MIYFILCLLKNLITVDIQYFFLLLSGVPCSVRLLYNSRGDLPDQFSPHLAPHTAIAVLLTTFSMPCLQIPGLSKWLRTLRTELVYRQWVSLFR